MHRFGLPLTFIVLCLAEFFSPSSGHAQLTIGDISSPVKSCDDLATQQMGDPFDMSNSADINNFFAGTDVIDLASPVFSGGVFSATTTSGNSTFYLWSPAPCYTEPVGCRWGQNLNIDTTKYRKFSIRMFTDKADPWGLQMIWDRGCNYANTRTVIQALPTKPGWHTYTWDLNMDAHPYSNSVMSPWSQGSITGFAVMPATQGGANIAVDWIRIEDPDSCGSTKVGYDALPRYGASRFNLYIDDDDNPFNGFTKQLARAENAEGRGSVALSSLGLAPGSYKAIGYLDDDYATLERTDPWDMNESTDAPVIAGVNGAVFSGGALSGTTASVDPSIYLKLADAPIDAALYGKLSLKLSRSRNDSPIAIFWRGANGVTSGAHVFYPSATGSVGGDVYQVDLSSYTSWSGQIGELVIRPATVAGENFSLDFVSLRINGFDRQLDPPSVVSSSTPVVVNDPPLIAVETPNEQSGEALRPWNMNPGDFVVFNNLLSSTDPRYPAEQYSTYLPDVRTVDGLRGDFFKGTSVSGPGDPVNYSTFPFGVANPITFDASAYHRMCFRLLIDNAFSLGLGSMARVIWQTVTGSFETGDDITLITDRWNGSRWGDYCFDMRDYNLETNGPGWQGQIHALRVDPHEFPEAVSYYFDFIKLRTDPVSHGHYAIVYSLNDSDSANATLSLYYNSTQSTTGGTLIASGLKSSDHSYIWDTSSLSSGAYYVYGVADDGLNSVSRLARSPLVVDNDSTKVGGPPALLVEAPQPESTICRPLQVKGYALQTDRFENVSSVQIILDGRILRTTVPSLYSPPARAAYPSLDSSNAGFDERGIDPGVRPGPHTLEVKAIGSDGQSSSVTLPITYDFGNCPALVEDAPPAGTPASAMDPSKQPEATPIPAATPRAATPPRIDSVKLDRNGGFRMQISRTMETSSSCRLGLFIGSKSAKITTLVKTIVPSKSKVTARGKKLKVDSRKLRSLYFKVKKECAGLTAAVSPAKSMKISTKGTLRSLGQVQKSLKKGLSFTGAR